MAIFKRSISLKSISDLASVAYQETVFIYLLFPEGLYVPSTVLYARFQWRGKTDIIIQWERLYY